MGGGMGSLGLPPFTKAVKWIIISNFAIYFVKLLVAGLKPEVAQEDNWLTGP